MPPYRGTQGPIYDPDNLVMLTSEQMQQLSPQELQAATEQLDQHLILVLRQIEENFAKCNQVVVEELLPSVEQHGENSVRIYESIKFWRPFFEAAASTPLNGERVDDSASIGTEEIGQTSTTSPDRTVSSEGDRTYARQSLGSEGGGVAQEEGDLEGTPRAARRHEDFSNASSSLPPEPQWSTDNNQFASPFLASSDRHMLPANSAMKQPLSSSSSLPDQQLQRLRLRDLPPDSPDVPEPEFETAVFGGGLPARTTTRTEGGGGGTTKGKGREFDLSIDSTGSPSFSLLKDSSRREEPSSSRNVQLGGKPQSKLLDKILRQNLTSSPAASKGSHSRKKPQQFPPDVPRQWNGIADLSHTALDAFPSPIKRRLSVASTTGGGGDEDESFVRMMAANVPHSVNPTLGRSISSSSVLTSSPAPPQPHPNQAQGPTSRFPSHQPQQHQSIASSSHSRPPPPQHSSYASPSKFIRTPAKYAAKLTARNVYEALGLESGAGGTDSPLPSPPSILRTQHKAFDLGEHTQRQENLRLSMAHQPREAEEEEEYEEPEMSPTTEKRSRIITSTSTSNSASRAGGGGGGGGERFDESIVSEAANSMNSMNQPPSFIHDPPTRAFDLHQHQQEQLFRSRRSQVHEEGLAEGFEEQEDDEEAAMDEFLGKTMSYGTERITFAAPIDFGGIVDDDEQHYEEQREGEERMESTRNGGERYEEEEMSYAEEEEDEGNYDQRNQQEGGGGGGREMYEQPYGDEDESFNIERGLRGAGGGGGGGGFGNRLLDGPEDTLFGMPTQPSQPSQPQSQAQSRQSATAFGRYEGEEEEDDTFTETQEPLRPTSGAAATERGGAGQGFRLHGMSDMITLHGGELLSSEPFIASPLAGRWGPGGGSSQQ
ncbi:uncharacterized protein JCM6883_006395 [Sporobolomyces salmoneus]|uniref:uncharacterized protein n=1 Tax=Sporobolomyces salmoneus TaxID=183962 RepID=UPI003173DCA2